MNLARINTSYPIEETEHYLQEGLFRVAPSSNPLRESSRVYADHFDTFAAQTDGKTQKYFEFLQFVRDLEMPGEISVRFRVSRSKWMAFHIWSDEPHRSFELAQRNQSNLILSTASFVAAKYYSLGIGKTDKTSAKLSPREKDCLLWLSRGEKQQTIADRLSINLKTVEMHLSNARSKMKSMTTIQAVSKAIVTRQIDP